MTELEHVLEVLRLKDQAPLPLDRQHTALLVVDMQRYFVRPNYPFAQVFEKLVPGMTKGYFARVQSRVVPNIQRLLACFRAQRLPVIYTALGTCMGDGRDMPHCWKEFDRLGMAVLGTRVWPAVGDASWEVDDSVAPQPGELVINKMSSGPLNSTRLDQTLHNLGVTSLIVTGLTSEVCVTQTARETADRGFRVVVAEDACTCFSEEMHRSALNAFCLAFGRVRPTENLVNFMSTEAAPAAQERGSPMPVA
jgi:nicotinamidase-related amidase